MMSKDQIEATTQPLRMVAGGLAAAAAEAGDLAQKQAECYHVYRISRTELSGAEKPRWDVTSRCRRWSMPMGQSGRARRGRRVVAVSRPIAHRRRSCPTAEGVDEGGVLRKAEQET